MFLNLMSVFWPSELAEARHSKALMEAAHDSAFLGLDPDLGLEGSFSVAAL